MKGSSTELKVGIFAIIVIAFLSYMTVKVGSLPMLWEKGYRIFVEFDDIKGLDEQSRIKVAGVDVGIVEKIDLIDGRARLTLLINPDIRIYGNAKAFLRMSGLLGDRYLALATGSPEEPLLNDGDTIIYVVPAADIDMLANQLADAASNIGGLTRSINNIFGEEEKDSIRKSINDLKVITANLREISSENKEPINRIIARLESFTDMLDDRGPIVMDDISRVAKSWGEEGPKLVASLKEAADELRETIGENRESIRESMENIKTASRSASEISGKIERGEGTLGKLLTDETLYDNIQKVSSEVGESIDIVGRLKTFMDFHSEYNTNDAEWKGYFDLTIQPRPNKYYILGIVTDPMGSVETTDRIVNGVKTTEDEVTSKIEFSAQYGQRFNDVVLRIGLLENTFGFGADYYFYNDRGKIKFDIWDFSAKEVDAERAHAKIGVDYTLFKRFFVSGGVDNLLNSNRRGIYLGGGIKFEDEDLKYLLGNMPSFSLQ